MITIIPKEIIHLIFSEVPFETYEYFKLSQVCRSWKNTVADQKCIVAAAKAQLSEEPSVLNNPNLFRIILDFFKKIHDEKPYTRPVSLHDFRVFVSHIIASGFEIYLIQHIKIEGEKDIRERLRTSCYDQKSIGIVKFLIRKLIEIKGDNSTTYENLRNELPLHTAVRWNRANNIVKLFLDLKANVNEVSEGGFTPLLWASYNGNLEIVQLLLKQNALVNIETSASKDTPLYASAQNGNFEITRALLEHGSNVHHFNHIGKTALFAAIESKYFDVVELLLENGSNPNHASNSGETPLSKASSSGKTMTVKILLDYKANVNTVAEFGYTPLIEASARGYNEIVKLLIDHGADVTLTTENGYTSLHWASLKGYVEVVKLHLQSKDLNHLLKHKSSCGKTPLDFAIENQRLEVVEILSKYNSNEDS